MWCGHYWAPQLPQTTGCELSREVEPKRLWNLGGQRKEQKLNVGSRRQQQDSPGHFHSTWLQNANSKTPISGKRRETGPKWSIWGQLGRFLSDDGMVKKTLKARKQDHCGRSWEVSKELWERRRGGHVAPGNSWWEVRVSFSTQQGDQGGRCGGREWRNYIKKKKSSLAWEWRTDGRGARVRPALPAGLHQRPEQKLTTAWCRALAAETEKMAFWRVNQQALLRASGGGGL